MEPSTTIVLRADLTPEALRRLHHHQELSIREIAAHFDVSVRTIRRALVQHGIDQLPTEIENHKPHLVEQLTKEHLTERLHTDQLTVAQIAAEHDCSVQTIYNYIDLHDIELPDRPPHTHKPNGLTVGNVTKLYLTQGLGVRDTAKIIGVSDYALRTFMDEHGIERRQPSQHQLDANELAARYKAGATLKEIAAEHNCSIWAISKRLDDLGVKRRIGKRPPVT